MDAERTLILLKPDAVKEKFCGKVITRFENAGFKIVACKMMMLRPDVLKEHYAHVADKPFYPEIETFMSQTPVIAMVLEGPNVVNVIRETLGATDPKKAVAGTLRAELGKDVMVNVAHASDSNETAQKEVDRFFRPEEIFIY